MPSKRSELHSKIARHAHVHAPMDRIKLRTQEESFCQLSLIRLLAATHHGESLHHSQPPAVLRLFGGHPEVCRGVGLSGVRRGGSQLDVRHGRVPTRHSLCLCGRERIAREKRPTERERRREERRERACAREDTSNERRYSHTAHRAQHQQVIALDLVGGIEDEVHH